MHGTSVKVQASYTLLVLPLFSIRIIINNYVELIKGAGMGDVLPLFSISQVSEHCCVNQSKLPKSDVTIDGEVFQAIYVSKRTGRRWIKLNKKKGLRCSR